MKYNRHLKAIGLKKEDLPSYWFEGEDRQKEDEDGFREVEFYNLDQHLACYIYSYLCEGRDIFILFPPRTMERDRWERYYDKMVKAFRLYLTKSNLSKNQQKQMNFGMRLFVKYFSHLWY